MLRILLATIVLLLSGSLAHAAADCSVHIDSLDFGTVDAIGDVKATTNGEVSVSCDGITPGTSTITLCGNIGDGTGGVAGGVRQITSDDGGSLGFALYSDNGETLWGSTESTGLGSPYEIDLRVGDGDSSGSATARLYGAVLQDQQSTPVGSYHTTLGVSDVTFTYAEGTLNCAQPTGGTQVHSSFAVAATVAANCLLQTTDLDFGTAGIIGANIDADADLGITCTPGTGYSISIDGGGSHDPDHRLLRSGDNTVSYGLYPDTTFSRQWGTAPGATVSGTGNGTATHHAVHGRIPPQPAVAGAYADTVVVTITY